MALTELQQTARRRRFQFSLGMLFFCLLVFSGICGWLVSAMECPVCHGDNVDENGRCRLGDGCQYFTDDWCFWCGVVADWDSRYITGRPGHIRMAYCAACRRQGTITRLEWLSRP